MSNLNEETIKRISSLNENYEDEFYTEEALEVYRFIQEEMTDNQRKQLFIKYNDSYHDIDEVRMSDFWDWLEMLDSDEIEDLVKDLPELNYKEEESKEIKKETIHKYNTKGFGDYNSAEEYGSAVADDKETILAEIESLKHKVNTDELVYLLDRVTEYITESCDDIINQYGIKEEAKEIKTESNIELLTTTSNKGQFFIGDPCYVLPDEIYHKIWGDKHGFEDGRIETEEGTFLVHGTAYGDGEYFDEDPTHNSYSVDAGVIAVIPIELIDPEKESDMKLGNVFNGKNATLKYNNGKFIISIDNQIITIDTTLEDEDNEEE